MERRGFCIVVEKRRSRIYSCARIVISDFRLAAQKMKTVEASMIHGMYTWTEGVCERTIREKKEKMRRKKERDG